MRLLHVQVPPEAADRVLSLAGEHGATWTVALEGRGGRGEERALVSVSVPNERAGALIFAVWDEVEGSEFLLDPYGVLPLQPPASEVQRQVRNVRRRSTLELVLSSLQSLGSWRTMLLYALLSGVVAVYAVVVDAVYLLVAGMLIAPMGAPAMVAVIGVTVGDRRMFGRGAVRFAVSVAVLVLTAVVFGAAVGLGQPSRVMEQITSLSAWTALLAAVAGAAGALSQLESERASLVTGTATGFLVAAALSPTSAVLGLAIVLARWDYASLMGFQLGLQFVAIVAGGWLVLLLFGVRPGDATAGRGSARWRTGLAGALVAATLLLVALQQVLGPEYRKADLSRQATDLAREAVRETGDAALVAVDARFVRANLDRHEGEVLLATVLVENRSTAPPDSVAARTRRRVTALLEARLPGVRPLVDVTVLPPR